MHEYSDLINNVFWLCVIAILYVVAVVRPSSKKSSKSVKKEYSNEYQKTSQENK